MSTDGYVSHEDLLKQVKYDPTTGIFTRLVAYGRIKAGTVAGSGDGKGYLRISVLNRNYSQHRLAWFYVHRYWPVGCIDHIDRNPSNNRISNLRDCSLSQNQWNREKGVSSKTGLPVGVSLEKRTGKFYARIGHSWKTKHLGTFDTPEEAKAAWDVANYLRQIKGGL